ncbi:MAG: ATP-binding region, ATPase domain protein [Marmoricola sp.]|nr:ATP-binding region, ATPase domain protein [Marmoricola sp.]
MTAALQEPESLRVVIIDDTADLRELLRMALIRGGMQVVGEAGDGAAGIEAVRNGNPDVVLLDLSMPVMDGLEALPAIRELAPDARIIVLSGFGASRMSERALEIGADAYLQKGASLGRILDYIRDIVSGSALRVVDDPTSSRSTPVATADASETTARPIPEIRPVAPDAVALAPYGVLEVTAEPPYRVVAVNPAALDLLESVPWPDAPLASVAPTLATTLAHNRLSGDLTFETHVGPRSTHVSLKHAGDSLLLFLQPTADEVATLRTAIATTAHEIRGPVSVLRAIAETLSEQGTTSPEDGERMLASIVRQARMLEGISADLITASAIQRGTLRVEARTVDPFEVIAGVVGDRYADTVTIQVMDARPVTADPLRLEQMLGNLLANAHKYGRPPVTVLVRASGDHEQFVCIDVNDSGFGVPVEFRPHLFREFSRASGTASAGTGLGLHVVRTLAQAQGGSVMYSSGPSGGATFSITLPAG